MFKHVRRCAASLFVSITIGTTSALAQAMPFEQTEPNQIISSTPMSDDQITVRNLIANGKDLARQNDLQHAAQMFEQALVIEPRNADALYNLGAVNQSYGSFFPALAYYKQADQERPNDPEIQRAIGDVQDVITRFHYVIGQGPAMYPVPTNTPIGFQPMLPNPYVSFAPAKKSTSIKGKGLLHKIGQIAKIGVVVAGTVLSAYANQAPPADSCD
ncbi:MAG TPA: tetratricopeptide repeat protein [Planktothrix sp.]|jgi:tetratricopeptide (TPR) repeat protein